MPDYPQFVGGSSVAQSPVASGERTVNWYVETGPTGPALYPTPGVSTFATSTDSPGRGHFAHDGRDFAVIGTGLYELSSSGTLTLLGSVAIDNYPATFCTNGDGGSQLLVSSGNNGYVFDLVSGVFSQVRTGGTRMVAHLDGYGLALDADTSTLFLSDNLDFTTWDPTQFAQRSIAADPWVALKVLDSSRYAYLLGQETSETWYDNGTFPFPFAPHPSGLMSYGCAAPFSAVNVAGSLVWLSQTKDGAGQVVSTSGFSPDVVSTFAVSVALAGFTVISDAIGDTYQDLGHTFYLLTFPTQNATICFDATTALQITPDQRWTERGTWISGASRYDAWRPLYHAYAFGTHLMLDRAGGAVYALSSEVATDADARPLRRLRRPPGIYSGATKRTLVGALTVRCEAGLGLTTGQGSDPQMALRISDDSGKTYGSERWRSAGLRGQYGVTVEWLRCGASQRGQSWVPEIVVSDPIPWRITGAEYATPGSR